MSTHKQLQVIRACTGRPLTTTEIAERLGRGDGGDTKALADRVADAGDVVRLPHPKRKDATRYQASPQGLDQLVAEDSRIALGGYLILIGESLAPAAAAALTEFVLDVPPVWMLRVHGRYRLVIAYDDSAVADALERDVTQAAGDAAALAVVRVDRQEFPMKLLP